jgi:hypothetical protein
MFTCNQFVDSIADKSQVFKDVSYWKSIFSLEYVGFYGIIGCTKIITISLRYGFFVKLGVRISKLSG